MLATFLIGYIDATGSEGPIPTAAYIDAESEEAAVKVVQRWEVEEVIVLPLRHEGEDPFILQGAKDFYLSLHGRTYNMQSGKVPGTMSDNVTRDPESAYL